MALLTAAQYPAARALIDVSLDSTVLPDSVIALDPYAGAAERWVITRDPLALSRTGDDLLRVTAAAVYYLAALLVPAIPTLVSETFDAYRYQRTALDTAALVASLLARAEGELAEVLDVDTVDAYAPPFFTVAAGSRGL